MTLSSHQIIWENRFEDDIKNDCLISVDGTDFRIAEHGRSFFSHKFKKSGLRYEVGIALRTGKIVWINGPFPCGAWPDISIFRSSLLSHLERGERVEADDGYLGKAPGFVKCPKSATNPEECQRMQAIARNRQETVNNRFKNWGILRQLYCHDILKHGSVFEAIVVLTEVAIENGEKLFDINYEDPPPTRNE